MKNDYVNIRSILSIVSVQDYETRYVGERLYTFNADEISLQCFVQETKLEVVSIIFDKQLFERDFLLQWLSYFGVHVGAAGKSARIPNADTIDRAYLFFDHIVTRYIKGQETLTVKREGLKEWTDYNRPLVEKILDTEGRRNTDSDGRAQRRNIPGMPKSEVQPKRRCRRCQRDSDEHRPDC